MWDKAALTGIVFSNDKWNFTQSETRAAVRIGRDWVNASTDVEWFRATEQRNTLVVPIRYYPVERLLNHANSVTLRHDGADYNVPLDRTKMRRSYWRQRSSAASTCCSCRGSSVGGTSEPGD
jgi:hypothetical protein